MKEIEIYHINWDRYVVDNKSDWLSDTIVFLDKKSDYGLYQLYGDHPIYGKDVLLYIGKAELQNLKTRISQHTEWYENNIKNYTRIHIGRFLNIDDVDTENWGNVISKSETLLINAHNPALNKQDVNRMIIDKNNLFSILNWNDYGDLLPEVCSLRYSYYYWDEKEYNFNSLIKD